MKQRLILTLITSATISLTGCNKQGDAENAGNDETPDAVDEDGPMEEAGEWTDEAAADTEDAFEEAAEETSDELDGDPETD